MAGNNVRVNTDQVAGIATRIEVLNRNLTEELNKDKIEVDKLASVWQGEAAQATIQSFDAFAANYFKKYEDVLTQYVRFLRTNVDSGYFNTETQNIKLADAFK